MNRFKGFDLVHRVPEELWTDVHNIVLLLLSRVSHVQLCDPIDSSPPGSAIPEILQARILEWVAMPSSRGFS